MKKLYEFTINKEEEVIKEEVSQNDKGETIKTEKKVKEKVPYKFFVRKPNRTILDEGDLYYGVIVAEGVKAGLLTHAQLWKRFANDGGVLSDPERENIRKNLDKLAELQIEFQELSVNQSEDKEENKKKAEKILGEIGEIRLELQRFELQQSALFDHTAEARARNKLILWYVLNLAYKYDQNNNPIPYFGNGSLEEKLKTYDVLDEEGNEFNSLILKKFLYIVSFWNMGRATTEEDFKKIDEISDKDLETGD